MPDTKTGSSPASWEQVYKVLEPGQLPWNAGGPDLDLIRLVEAHRIPPGRAVDLGAGPGHDAVFLARAGFSVLAVDIAAGAVNLAKANANLAGVGEKIEFQVADALSLSVPPASVAFFNDRGFFHFLPAEKRNAYLDFVLGALAAGGLLLLRTFSDKEHPGPGPARFSANSLKDLFSPAFDCLELKEGTFQGPHKPNPKALLLLLKKR